MVEHDLDHFLQYKLCVHPVALFDEGGMMREARKSQQADAIGHKRPRLEHTNTKPAFAVFDGGSLLHQIQCKKENGMSTWKTKM